MTPRQLACWLRHHGSHDWRVTWQGSRLFEKCADCQRERPGWQIDVDPKLQEQRQKRNRYIAHPH
jgi:hypothetical protein